MANTSSPTRRRLSVGVRYGFLGGPLAARRMRRLLEAAGYEWRRDPKQADIVIAHSAGCWELDGLKPRLLLLVGLPLAKPGPRASFRANRARTKAYLLNRHIIRGAGLLLANWYYALRQPRRNLTIIRQASRLQTTASMPGGVPTVFVINRDDPWPANRVGLERYIGHKSWNFIGLPGSHDDIWENPERYVDIINRYARLLA